MCFVFCAVVTGEGRKASRYAVATLVLLFIPVHQKLGGGRGIKAMFLVWPGWLGGRARPIHPPLSMTIS